MEYKNNPLFCELLTTGDEWQKVHPHYNVPLDYDEIIALSLITIGLDDEIVHINHQLYKPRRKSMDELAHYRTGYTDDMLADMPVFDKTERNGIQKIFDEATSIVGFNIVEKLYYLKNEGINIDNEKVIELNNKNENGKYFSSIEDLCDYYEVPHISFKPDPVFPPPIHTGIRCYEMEELYRCICNKEKYKAQKANNNPNDIDDEGVPF